MTPPKLIIFDCDGVLVDSEPVTNAFLLDDLNQLERNGTPHYVFSNVPAGDSVRISTPRVTTR